MTQDTEDIESIADAPRQPKRAEPRVLGARSDEAAAGLDSLTPVEVHMADGQVLHTSLAKLDALLESLRAARKEQT